MGWPRGVWRHAITAGRPNLATAVTIGLDWQDPNTLRFSSDGKLWISCERGLTWLKPNRLTPNSRGELVPDPASAEPVFGRYPLGDQLPKTFPLGLVEDRDGSMWVGSLGGGLFHVTNGRLECLTQKEGLPGVDCVPVHLTKSSTSAPELRRL